MPAGAPTTERRLRDGAARIEAQAWTGSSPDTTAVSMVNEETDTLLYRGYPVEELAASFSSRRWPICLHGELPSGSELPDFQPLERRLRGCPAVLQCARRTSAELHPDGRASHGGELARGLGPTGRRRSVRGQPRQGAEPAGQAAHRRRRRAAPPTGPAADRPRSGFHLHRELLPDVLRRASGPRGAPLLRGLPRPLRRAQLQRLHLHRAGDHLDALRPLLRGHRGIGALKGPLHGGATRR